MQELWRRIEAWFASNFPPEAEFSLPPGASEAVIKQAEEIMQVQLPEDVRESYLIHDGADKSYGPFETHTILSLEGAVKVWRDETQVYTEGMRTGELQRCVPPQLVGPIRPVLWNRRWIPIADEGSGDQYCIDLDPPRDGNFGQVIYRSQGAGPVRVLATSFSALLSEFADALEDDKFFFGGYELARRDGEPD